MHGAIRLPFEYRSDIGIRVLPLLRTVLLLVASFVVGTAGATPLVELATFQDSPDPVASTQQLTHQLIVNNVSDTLPADGVTLNVPIPSGATFVSVSNASCSYSAPNVFCSFGTMAPDTNRVVDIVMQVTASGGATLSSTAVAHSAPSVSWTRRLHRRPPSAQAPTCS